MTNKGYWIGAAHFSISGLGDPGARRGGFDWISGEYKTRMFTDPTTGQAR
jgi:hypothetical protein